MGQTIQNSTQRFISDYLDIVCALINKYQCPAVTDTENGRNLQWRCPKCSQLENRYKRGSRNTLV